MSIDEIPGYKEALEQERTARNLAFIQDGHFREIAGFKVVPMTLVHLSTRLHIGCPFLSGREPSRGDIASFLWHLSPDYQTPRPRRFWERDPRDVFLSKLARAPKVPFEIAIAQINEYFDWTFLDAPSGRSGCQYTPKTSFASTIVHFVAFHYHWSESEILRMPLIRLYQYIREILLAKNPSAAVFNRRSDKIRGNYLRSINAMKNAATPTPMTPQKAPC